MTLKHGKSNRQAYESVAPQSTTEDGLPIHRQKRQPRPGHRRGPGESDTGPQFLHQLYHRPGILLAIAAQITAQPGLLRFG